MEGAGGLSLPQILSQLNVILFIKGGQLNYPGMEGVTERDASEEIGGIGEVFFLKVAFFISLEVLSTMGSVPSSGTTSAGFFFSGAERSRNPSTSLNWGSSRRATLQTFFNSL